MIIARSVSFSPCSVGEFGLALAAAVLPSSIGEQNLNEALSNLDPPLQRRTAQTQAGSLFGWESPAWAIASVLLALLLAGAGLARHRFPDRIQQSIDRVIGPLNRSTNRLHSGDVGDYVAWMTVRLAALGVGLAVFLRR